MQKDNGDFPRSVIRIVMADDDPDDRLMAQEALEEARVANPFDTVENGEALLAYLRLEGDFAYLSEQSLPGLILLDLNMPRKDGREALKEIKGDPRLRQIPIVVLTTSKEEEDICRSYDMGVNSFIVKPVTFAGLVNVMKAISRYWLEIVELPRHGRQES